MKNEEGYYNLANAIVLQAVFDYKKAKKKGNYGEIKVFKNFFNSTYCEILTGGIPIYEIIKQRKLVQIKVFRKTVS